MEKTPTSRIIKPVHPKVTKIRMYLHPSSPIRLVRDHYQPKSGYLSQKPILPTQMQVKLNTDLLYKKEINLDLSLNKMRNSRTTIPLGAS